MRYKPLPKPKFKKGGYSIRQTFLGVGVASWILAMMGASNFFGTSFLLGLAVLLTTFFHGCVLYWIYRRRHIPNKFLK